MIQYLLKGESTSRLKVQSLFSQLRYHNVFYNVKMSMLIYLFYIFLQHLAFNVFFFQHRDKTDILQPHCIHEGQSHAS